MRKIAFADLPGLVGEEVGVSDWITVTHDPVDAPPHAELTRAPHGASDPTIDGFRMLSLLSRTAHALVLVDGVSEGVSCGLNKVRLPTPARTGTRVRTRVVLMSAEPKWGGLALTCACTVEIEGQPEPALIAEWIGIAFA
jgi:hypothetical protein